MTEKDTDSVVMNLSKENKKWLDNIADASEKNLDTEFLETQNIGFDLSLTNGLGIPVGSSVLFYAEPGCGKTTLAGDVSRRLLNKAQTKGDDEFKILYLATENSKELLKSLGLGDFIASGKFIYIHQEFCWRQVETIYNAVLTGYGKFKGVKLIIIDSSNNVLADAELTKSVADGDFGSRPKERGRFYSKYFGMCAEKGITTFLISQVRQDQEAGMYGDKKKAAATWVDLHNVEMILKCSRKSDKVDASKVKYNTAFGEYEDQTKWVMKLQSSSTNCKNRFFNGFPAEVLVVKGKGIDNTYAARKLLEANGYVKKTGGWYSFSKELQENFKFPDSKLRASECNTYIKENIKDLINMLKESDQYKIETSKEVIDSEEENE